MSTLRAPLLEGCRAIAAALSRAVGYLVSRHGVYRLTIRAERPLPLTGYRGRPAIDPTRLRVWLQEEVRWREGRRRLPSLARERNRRNGRQ